jgi:RNA polymerase-binding transcription factor DksA
MAKKKVTKKKTRSTSARKPSSAAARSKTTKKPASTAKKRARTTTKPAKTARKSAAKVVAKKSAKKSAKKPTKKTTKKTAKKAPTTTKKKPVTQSTAATTGTKKKVTTKTTAGSRKTSSKTTTKSRSRSAKRPSPDANGYVIINGRRVRMMAVAVTPVPVVTKRVRSRVKASAVPDPAITTKKTIKTKLGRKELNEYRTQLLIQRAELVGDLSAMEAQALRSGGGNPSHMPIHMADVGTDTFDQDFMLGMAETERRRLREIDAALKRIEDRTYGVCEMSGKTIPKARLAAKPWARFTIESAREFERGQSE